MDSLLRALDGAADGAYLIDGDQRIVYWNQSARRLLGYEAEEVLGRRCYELIQGRDDHNHPWCRGDCYVTATSRDGGSVESFTTHARTKSGERRWIHVSILAIPDSGQQNGPLIMHLFRDASELKQQEWFTNQVLSAVQGLQEPPAAPSPPARSQGEVNELTDREFEVLMLLAQGLSTALIAERLSISTSTTRNHIQNILQKLHVHSRAAAVAHAFEHGLIPSR